MGKLEGKVAIVTGAARGLGRAYARRLAGLGAKVAGLGFVIELGFLNGRRQLPGRDILSLLHYE